VTRAGVSLLLLLAANGVILDAARPRMAPAATGIPGPELGTPDSTGVLTPPRPTVVVELIVRPGQFREWFLQQVRQEAEAIWQKNDVTIAWHGGPPNACAPLLRVWLARTQRRSVLGDSAMGSILFDHGVPLPVIHLSVENVEALIRAVPLLAAAPPIHDAQLARALGRTLAHEIGHYVLSRQTHERRGLMRATWPIQEAVAADRRNFDLMPDQRAFAVERLAAERAACGDAENVDDGVIDRPGRLRAD